MRKFGNVFPLADDVFPPELDVVVVLFEPPPPHPAATSASVAAKAATVNHFHRLLRIKSVPPRSFDSHVATGATRRPSARCILPDASGPKLVRTALADPFQSRKVLRRRA